MMLRHQRAIDALDLVAVGARHQAEHHIGVNALVQIDVLARDLLEPRFIEPEDVADMLEIIELGFAPDSTLC